MTVAVLAVTLQTEAVPASPTLSRGEGRPAVSPVAPGAVNIPIVLVRGAVQGDGRPPVALLEPAEGFEASLLYPPPAEPETQPGTQERTNNAATTPPVPSDQLLYELRRCESTDNYTVTTIAGTSTPSRATGAYQFEQPTWDETARLAGRPDLVAVRPAHAAPHDQDAMARALWRRSGPRPWPTCGYRALAKAGA